MYKNCTPRANLAAALHCERADIAGNIAHVAPEGSQEATCVDD